MFATADGPMAVALRHVVAKSLFTRRLATARTCPQAGLPVIGVLSTKMTAIAQPDDRAAYRLAADLKLLLEDADARRRPGWRDRSKTAIGLPFRAFEGWEHDER
ncbi:MAG: hypothetical protein WCI94_09375 [Rhodospirillales bacterium]